jgi:hypothetical protein
VSLPRITDDGAFGDTRVAWHALGEHVLAAARYAAEGRIGLQAVGGGFGTPTYQRDGKAEELQVVDRTLHVVQGSSTTEHTITTISAAAAAVGIEPGAPAHVYTPVTSVDFDATLAIDDDAASALAAWFDLAWSALERFGASAPSDADATSPTLWPEHFDAAIEVGSEALGQRGTFGASPGDDQHPHPYLYVTHWTDTPDDSYWNDTAFAGASLSYDALAAEQDPSAAAVDFFTRGARVLSASS